MGKLQGSQNTPMEKLKFTQYIYAVKLLNDYSSYFVFIRVIKKKLLGFYKYVLVREKE
jgi:hypothetical protein